MTNLFVGHGGRLLGVLEEEREDFGDDRIANVVELVTVRVHDEYIELELSEGVESALIESDVAVALRDNLFDALGELRFHGLVWQYRGCDLHGSCRFHLRINLFI